MRRPFIAGNWKMNLSRDDAQSLATELAAELSAAPDCDIAVCPPFVYLETVRTALGESCIALGAQNMYPQPSGAFTGETSPTMLLDLGCQYVILGHSERRHILGETDDQIFGKVTSAIAAGLKPIVCVGETLEERQSDQTASVIQQQFEGSISGLDESQFEKVTIAYEPVWAIGTGEVATPDQAEAVHADLRTLIQTRYNTQLADSVRIQYGGSVKPGNVTELMAQPNIDGALVGGASLAADSFLGIVRGALDH